MRAFAVLIQTLVLSAAALPCNECPGGSSNDLGITVTHEQSPKRNNAASSGISGSSNFDWGMGAKGTVKGVNLGGWLLLEPWITPSIFKDEQYVDEYTFCEKNPNAEKDLKGHWERFITEKDFKQMSEIGFNMVRIGVGYWSFKKVDTDPYIMGAAKYLDKAVKWAEKYGIKVLVDLHGAPGSQNGFDNSGQFTKNATWTRGDNIEHTLDVIQMIGKRYANNPAVAAIGLLNEPFPQKLGYQEQTTTEVVNYHNCGAKIVREASNPSTAVTISDAFTNAFKWNDEYPQTGPGANIIDHHDYQVFDDAILMLNLTAHIEQVSLNIEASVANSTHPTIIGEWSGAMTDCAKYLNGRGEGARFENKFSGTSGANGTCSKSENSFEEFEKDEGFKRNTTEFLAEQVKVYSEKTNGFFFWTWKTESAPPWDAQFLHKVGAFPKLR